MNTIVVGYDGSDGSERALERAAELAKRLDAGVVVVSVVPAPRLTEAVPVAASADARIPAIPAPTGSGTPMVMPWFEERGPEPRDMAEHRLEHARLSLAGKRVDAQYVAEVGDAADRLLTVAREREADLLVVGSREHGFLDRLLGRHVDEAVAAHAGCDVLLVH
jgi:nucleotide-binding universal stress UspA family protein